MSKHWVMLTVLVVLVLTGCMTKRSISNSEYYDNWGGSSGANELSELDIIGSVPDDAPVSGSTPFSSIKNGATILLIQSGAVFPDEPMRSELAKFLRVAPFSGVVSPKEDSGTDSFSQSLRLAARKGNCDYVICYWGILEASQKELATKAASWTPIVGRFVPDETQEMRIRLKMLIMETNTRKWFMLTSQPIVNSALSMDATRERRDQEQVELLKQQGYSELAEQLEKYVAE